MMSFFIEINTNIGGKSLLRIFTVRIFAARIFTVEDYHDTPAWCQIHFWLVRNSVSAKKWLIYIIKNWWIIIHQKTKILSLVIFDIHKREKYMNQKLAPLRKSITLKKKKTEVLISKIDSSIFFFLAKLAPIKASESGVIALFPFFANLSFYLLMASMNAIIVGYYIHTNIWQRCQSSI